MKTLLATLLLTSTLLSQTGGDLGSLSGGAGLAGAGLLGVVMTWLLFKYIPGKDGDTKDLLKELLSENKADRTAMSQRYDSERLAERDARHVRATEFHASLLKQAVTFQQALKGLEEQHKVDAKADRDAFMDRNNRVEDAIRLQTSELRVTLLQAMGGVCRLKESQ